MTIARRRTRPAVSSTHTVTAPREASKADWEGRALCRLVDAETFFPVGTGKEATAQEEAAKAKCRRCPVMQECGTWAVDTDQKAGVWGGLSEQELKQARRRRSRAVSSVDTALADRLVAEQGTDMLSWLLDEKAPLSIIQRRLGRRNGDGQLAGVPSITVLRMTFRRLGVPMTAMAQKPAVARAVQEWDTVEAFRAQGLSWRSISVRLGVGEEALREACTLIEQREAPPSVRLVMDEWSLVQRLRQDNVGQARIAKQLGVGVGTLREAIQVMEQGQLDEASDRTAVAS